MPAASAAYSSRSMAETLPVPAVRMRDRLPDRLKMDLPGQKSIQPDVQFYIHQWPASTISERDWLRLIRNVRVQCIFLLDSQVSDLSAQILSNWHSELKDRIKDLGRRPDGWKGPDSRAPETDAVDCALEMLHKLALAGIPRRPSIGLDFEGTFSFAWFDEDVSADMTVYADGTYSFFVSSNTCTASADDERIEEPIHSDLLNALQS